MNPKTIALMISVILWGTFLGGIVYSHIIFFPVYLSALPDSAILVNGPYALHEENFWMLIHPLLIVSLIISLAMNWKLPARRRLIAITTGLYSLAMITTILYFVPELRAFKASAIYGISREDWFARGQRWQYLSWLRGGLMFVAMVPLLLALTKPHSGNANP
jgi:hypothetical protein